MGLYRREEGSFQTVDPLVRSEGGYSDPLDKVWARIDGTWVQVHPSLVDIPGAVMPVENLRLDTDFVDNPTTTQAYVEWDLPSQPYVTPNEVWTRVGQISPIWSVAAYPLTTWSHLALDSNTGYTLDVMLVYNDGITPVMSVVRSLYFETDAGSISLPEDPGPGDKEDPPVIIDPPPPPPPGGGGPCTIYEVDIHLEEQQSDGTWDVVETHTGLDPDVGTWNFTYAYVPGTPYRGCVRGVCDAVPGDWLCGPPFTVAADGDDPCAAHDDAVWTSDVWDEAIFIIPRFCALEVVEDAISGTDLDKGPLYAGPTFGPLTTGVTSAILVGGLSSATWGEVVMGQIPGVDVIGPSASLIAYVNLQDDLPFGHYRNVLEVGGVLSIGIFGGVFGNQPFARYAAGGFEVDIIEGVTAFVAGEWTSIAATFDSDTNEVVVYLLGEEIGSASWDEAVSITGTTVKVSGGGGSKVAYLAGWDRVLTPEEIGDIGIIVPGSYDELVTSHDPIAYWTMASKAGDIFEDVVSTHDISLVNAADWTIHTGDLPNGDNSASIITASAGGSHWITDEFFAIDADRGTTYEAWVKVTVGANAKSILEARTDGTGIGTTLRHFQWFVDTTEQVVFQWFATNGSVYASVTSPVLLAGWHHLVVTIYDAPGAGGFSTILYVDGLVSNSTTSTTSTGTLAASDAYRLYLGNHRTNATTEMTDHMSKVAIYDYVLTQAEVQSHTRKMYDITLSYDETVMLDNPKAFWKLDAKDPVTYPSYDVAVLADSPKLFLKLNSKDTM